MTDCVKNNLYTDICYFRNFLREWVYQQKIPSFKIGPSQIPSEELHCDQNQMGVFILSFLEELYLNGYYPSEEGRTNHKDYITATAKVEEQTKIILDKLGINGDKFLDEYLSAKADQISYELALAFAQGMKLGIKIICETCEKQNDHSIV